MDILKPCPFCGKSAAELTNAKAEGNCMKDEERDDCPYCYEGFPPRDDCIHFVVCNVFKGGCGAASGWYVDAESAIAAWNRRAQDK